MNVEDRGGYILLWDCENEDCENKDGEWLLYDPKKYLEVMEEKKRDE